MTRNLLIQRKGFTVPELLAVVAVMLILLAMLLPILDGARRRARAVICLSNMHQLAVAHKSYAMENKQSTCHREAFLKDPPGWVGTGSWPNVSGIPQESILVRLRYLDGIDAFTCPDDHGYREDHEELVPFWYRYVRPASFSYTRNAEADARNPYPSFYRIRKPSQTCLTAEESEVAPMNGSEFYANPWDIMTLRHDNQCAMNFFDLHGAFINSKEFNLNDFGWRIINYLDP
ncbi:MAG: type II secretion system protein [Phycisphaeraceae bacterium]